VNGQSTNASLNIIKNDNFKFLINNNSKIEHVFYSLFSDQIWRNFRYDGQCTDGFVYKNNKWYIPTIIGKIKYIFARSYIFRKVCVPIIDKEFKQYYENYLINSLKEINNIVKEKYNSKLTIIVWPDIEVWPDIDDKFIIKLQGTKLDLIFLDEKFNSEDEDYRIKYDRHPTAKANKEIAEILYNHIKEK
jgi:hypothetical protein